MMSVAKYNRQNSNNSQKEMERSSKPMLEKQVSFVEPIKPRVERQHSFCRSPLLRQISRNTSLLMKCVVVVSLVLNLVLMAGTAVTLTLLLQNSCQPSPTQAPDLMCYPCGEDGIPGVPATQRTRNGYCCASRTDGKLQHLISRNILPSAAAVKQQQHQQVRQGRPCPPADHPKKSFSPKTIAHLLVNVKETKAHQSIRWIRKSSDGTAFLMGQLEISNNTIRVIKGGLYRVKSHFSLDSNNQLASNNTILFDHNIYKKRGDEFTALKVEKTMLPLRHYVSSDVDLNVKLRDGDSLLVWLHSYSYLYDMDIANTFDIEKID